MSDIPGEVNRDLNEQLKGNGTSHQLLHTILELTKALPNLADQDQKSLEASLGALGQVSRADQVFLCILSHGTDHRCQWYRWSREPTDEPIAPFTSEEIARLGELLEPGRPFFRSITQLPDPLPEALARQQVDHILLMPFFVEGDWWGFLRFDNCRLDHQAFHRAIETLGLAIGVVETALDCASIAQSLRAAKEQAEESSRLKDKFVALVAHDLRSPLHSMLGAIEYVLEDQECPPEESHRQLLDAAIQSGKNLLQVADDVLNIARLHTGTLRLERVFLDGYQIAEDVIHRLAHLAGQKGLQILNQLPKRLRLYGDRVLLGEVLLNLLSNAIKFSHPGGTIRILVPPEDRKESVLIGVQDQGVGIEPDIIPRLFKVEEKVTTPGTRGERGTGFGLPFSYEILEAHGGSLWVESTPGQGSTFFLQLPKVVPRVLVVDDMPGDRILMVAYLRSIGGIEILEAEHGEAALQVIESHRPHLVLTDVLMPKMDGFQLLEAITSDPKMKGIPVILVTADHHEETRDRAFSLGAADFTVKPVVPLEFLPRVRHFIV